MAEIKRIEIGFGGGQVVSIRVGDDALSRLRTSVEGGNGWFDLETEDGIVSLDLSKVVFVKTAGAPHTIGFSGT